MSQERAILQALEIELPLPLHFVVHDEGYMEMMQFHQKVVLQAEERDLTWREIQDLGMEEVVGVTYGEYRSYKDSSGIRHVHYYVSSQIQETYPSNFFVRGHEETHLLKPEFTNRYDLLCSRLASLGLDTTTFANLTTEDEIAHLGGLIALHHHKIHIDGEQDTSWHNFINQARHLKRDAEFEKSLEWFLMNKK